MNPKNYQRRTLLGALSALSLMVSFAAHAADITVLQISPQTGVNGGVGWQLEVGAAIAFSSVNSSGGIAGQKIKLVSMDENLPNIVEQVKSAAQSTNAVAMINLYGSQGIKALNAQKTLQTLGLPVVGVSSGAPSVYNIQDPYVTITRASHAEELETVFKQLNTVKVSKVAMLSSDDEDGKALVEIAKTSAKKNGIQLVTLVHHETNSAVVDEAVATILKTPHQAVILASNTPAVARFAQLYRSGRGTGQMIALSSAEATQMSLVVGREIARGVMISQVVPNPRNPKLLVMRDFTDAYRKFGPKDFEPTLAMTEGYLNARVLIEAMRKGGGVPSRNSIVKALGAMPTVPISGLKIGTRADSTGRLTSLSMIEREGRVLY